MPRALSSQRGKNGRAEKTGERGKNGGAEKTGERGAKKTRRGGDEAKRRRSQERFGSMFRGGLCRCHGTTTAQELVEDFSAALISSFQRGDELN